MDRALPLLHERGPTQRSGPAAIAPGRHHAPAPGERRPPAAPAEAHAAGVLLDSHGRVIRDLRISITDRCNFRCVYCLEPDARFLPPSQVLSVESIERVARIAIGFGIDKIRLTGGEPTVRAELEEIIGRVAALDRSGRVDVALTTNGATLEEASLRRWRDAGLGRLTISIDAVEPHAFARLTRARVGVDRVLEGIEAALGVGLSPLKLNAVIVRGQNEDQIVPLAGLARRYGIEMRFIEFMPLDGAERWDIRAVVPAHEVVAAINACHPLVALGKPDPSSTAERYRFADGSPGAIGIIAPVTKAFCGACSRLRITADGAVRPCLFSCREYDLAPHLRAGDDAAIRRFLVDATWTKQAGHGIASDHFHRPERSMSAIGG